jgi:nucleotide-binding universal stress UspA family protein
MNAFDNKPILVPVDLSDESVQAVDYALKIAVKPEQITILHVGAAFWTSVSAPYIYPVIVPDSEREAERLVRSKFSGDKYHGVKIVVRYGDAGHEICNYAQKISAGVIVMPSHGRTGLSHLLIGSVAERVVRYSPCPVLVLRGIFTDRAKATRNQEIKECSHT